MHRDRYIYACVYASIHKVDVTQMKPKAIPLLTEEQFAVLEQELKREPTAKDVERIKRAKTILKRHSF